MTVAGFESEALVQLEIVGDKHCFLGPHDRQHAVLE
jgi:hypothetical protein